MTIAFFARDDAAVSNPKPCRTLFGNGAKPPRSPAASARDAYRIATKVGAVIRVAIPIDSATVALAASDLFALATPLRIDEVIELAVREACGPRAPDEKRERAVRATLDGFAAGEFVVDVNGRVFESLESVVLCTRVAKVSFFSSPERRLQTT